MSLHNVTVNDRQKNTLLFGLRLYQMALQGGLLAATSGPDMDLVNPMDLPEVQDYHPMYGLDEVQNLADIINGVQLPPHVWKDDQ